MSLETLYRKVNEAVEGLHFDRIWPGFAPLHFALYNDDACFFDGRYVEKTDAFCANTSIFYEGEQIAIWKVQEETEIPVLASKLVHEMFHGYQTLQGWDCWPDELEALFRYEYRPENLSLKLRENKLLLSLLDRYDEAALRELLAHKALRMAKHPWEFAYEAKCEEIEGAANYVEWQVLRQLDGERAAALTERMRQTMTGPEFLFPIRISCYFTGALTIHALRSAGLYSFCPAQRPAILPILAETAPSDGSFPGKSDLDRAVSEATAAFEAESEAIVRTALERNEIVLTGPLELGFVNIYDARRWRDYLTSTYFLTFRDGETERMIPGNFVIRMRDQKTIDTVYRWK